MHNKWYWTFKYILMGPFLRVWNRPVLENGQNIPEEGSAILASSHQAVMDSFYFPLLCDRQLTHPAKKEYFTGKGIKGAVKRWFFTTVGQVPVDRQAKDAGETMAAAAQKVFDRGDLFCVYPEGTRSPDGRIYKGHTGMARIALATGEIIIPVGMVDTRKANPIGTTFPRPHKVRAIVGAGIDPLAWARNRRMDPADHETARALTDYVMHTLSKITGYEYVDAYASEVRASLEAGKGYPAGTEPKGDPAARRPGHYPKNGEHAARDAEKPAENGVENGAEKGTD